MELIFQEFRVHHTLLKELRYLSMVTSALSVASGVSVASAAAELLETVKVSDETVTVPE